MKNNYEIKTNKKTQTASVSIGSSVVAMSPPIGMVGHQQQTINGTAAALIGGHHSRELGKKRGAENDMFQLVPTRCIYYFSFVII